MDVTAHDAPLADTDIVIAWDDVDLQVFVFPGQHLEVGVVLDLSIEQISGNDELIHTFRPGLLKDILERPVTCRGFGS